MRPDGRPVGRGGDLAPARGCSHRGAPPPILFLRHQKENAPRPVEEKKCFGGSVRIHADLLPPAGEGWHSRAVIRDGNALPLGLSKPGEVPDTFRSAFTRKGYAASPRKGDATSVARRSRERLSSVRRQSRKRLRSRCRWPSLAGPWSGSGGRRRGHAIFHPDDRQAGKRGRVVWILEGSGASRQKTGSLYRNRFGRPPSRREPRKKRPFLLDRPRPIFFSTRRKRKWGVEWTGYHHSRIPRAAGCRPYTSPRESHRREPVWGRSSVLPFAPVGLPPRREGRVLRGEGDRNFIFETGISF